jgi:hypothetical protein
MTRFAQITGWNRERGYVAELVEKSAPASYGGWVSTGEEIAVRCDGELPLGRIVLVEASDTPGVWKRVSGDPVGDGGQP